MKVIQWKELYYFGYNDLHGVVWTRHKNRALLLEDNELPFHSAVLVKFEEIPINQLRYLGN